jgi:hypothetical protein
MNSLHRKLTSLEDWIYDLLVFEIIDLIQTSHS